MTDSAAQVALAHHFSPGTAALLIAGSEVRSLEDGQRLVDAGWPHSVLYFVLEGFLDVVLEEQGGTLKLGRIGPETCVGEAGFIDGKGATATVISAGPSRLLALRRDRFDSLCAEQPAAAAELLRVICKVVADRIHQSSSGLLQQASDHSFSVTHPKAEVGPLAALLARLFGGRSDG